jgi:hypothetical protein
LFHLLGLILSSQSGRFFVFSSASDKLLKSMVIKKNKNIFKFHFIITILLSSYYHKLPYVYQPKFGSSLVHHF